MILNTRLRVLLLSALGLALLFGLYFVGTDHASTTISDIASKIKPSTPSNPETPSEKAPEEPAAPATYKPVEDNFPLALAAHSASDLPPIPSWNAPPNPHVPEATPLFIGFTRNWRILQQAVVSYITAGWPPSDIYVIENTGVLDSNKRGLLSLQNPFFLNHTRLEMLGVNIIRTPTLLNFAQLQNFYLHTATENKWPEFFWSHQDVAALSFEEKEPFKSLYMNCVDALRETYKVDPETGKKPYWAMREFSYDHLTLVNLEAYVGLGGWDTHIPFYHTDCDMYGRVEMRYKREGMRNEVAGKVFDVATSLDDLFLLYRTKSENSQKRDDVMGGADNTIFVGGNSEDTPKVVEAAKDTSATEAQTQSRPPPSVHFLSDTLNSPDYRTLHSTLSAIEEKKVTNAGGRNTWQGRQHLTSKEPFYIDNEGFDQGVHMLTDIGKQVFAKKWGYENCDIVEQGFNLDTPWTRPYESKWWVFW